MDCCMFDLLKLTYNSNYSNQQLQVFSCTVLQKVKSQEHVTLREKIVNEEWKTKQFEESLNHKILDSTTIFNP